MTKLLRLTERADRLLSEISKSRKQEQALVYTKGGIVAELVMAAHNKEVAQHKIDQSQ